MTKSNNSDQRRPIERELWAAAKRDGAAAVVSGDGGGIAMGVFGAQAPARSLSAFPLSPTLSPCFGLDGLAAAVA